MGNFKPHLRNSELDSDTIHLEKEFDNKDYIKLEQPKVVPPTMNYHRQLFVKKNGFVQSGQSIYKYNVGQQVKLSEGE